MRTSSAAATLGSEGLSNNFDQGAYISERNSGADVQSTASLRVPTFSDQIYAASSRIAGRINAATIK
ncbi:hypothetical protein, partial [Escherichia coli]|uniref:hypothetical protein n=1 Tax=Escherichia coli TaxID=562 RepID=UPI001A7E8EB5